MKAHILLSLMLLPLTLGSASATTQLCTQQTTLQAWSCVQAGNFQGGDGSCETTGSWDGGGGSAFVALGGSGYGVALDNSCYAYSHEGTPYEGSQIAAHVIEWGPGGYDDHGAYLNSGVVHAEGGDHPYCYVTQIGPNGEDPDGIRVDCPVWFPVPYVLRGLP